MDTKLLIRPARLDDRPAMERICAHTWEDGDYIPQVWDEWLADARSRVIVGELEGRVVALSKITFHTPDQVWLAGMRVDPAHRRRGIARHFLEHSIAYAREQGARVVRLGTTHTNTPVHRLAAHVGMERIGSYALRLADPLDERAQPTFLSPRHADRVHPFLRTSPALARAHGLYSEGWEWQELTPERVDQFLRGAGGRIAARLDAAGDLLALATVHADPPDKRLWIGFAAGEPTALTGLAQGVRAYAAHLGLERVQVMLPDLPPLRESLRAAGFGPGEWQGELWIFEIRLEG